MEIKKNIVNRIIELSTRIVAVVVTVVVGLLATVGFLAMIVVTTLSVRNVADTKPAHVLRADTSLADHYLDVIKRHLTRSDYSASTEQAVPVPIRKFLNVRGLKLSQVTLNLPE